MSLALMPCLGELSMPDSTRSSSLTRSDTALPRASGLMRVEPVSPAARVRFCELVRAGSVILSLIRGCPSSFSSCSLFSVASQTLFFEKRCDGSTLPTQARRTDESTWMVALGGLAPHWIPVSVPIPLATSTCSGRCRRVPSRFRSGPSANRLLLSTSATSLTCAL